MAKKKTTNTLLAERAIQHAVYLERLKNGEVKKVLRLLGNEVLPDVQSKLTARLAKASKVGFDTGPRTTERLREMVDQTGAELRAGMSYVSGEVSKSLGDIAEYEAEFQAEAIRSAAPFELDLVTPDPAKLRSLIESRPLEGKTTEEWFGGLADSAQTRINKQLMLGVATGETVDQMSRRITGTKAMNYKDGVFNATKREAESIVRTGVNQASTTARETTYEENDEVISGVQIVATLDNRTTMICMAQDGKVYPVNEGPRPPFHWGCRTTTVPVLKSWEELGLGDKLQDVPDTTRASMDGEVPAKQTYGEWLKDKPDEFQDDVLGPARAELFRSGEVPIEGFVNDQGRTLTLAELKHVEEDPGVFALKMQDLTPEAKVSKIQELIAELNAASDPLAKKAIRSKLRSLDENWQQHKYGAPTPAPAPAPVPEPPPPPPPVGVPEPSLQNVQSLIQQLANEADPAKRKALIAMLNAMDDGWENFADFEIPELVDHGELDMSKWSQIGPQKGSNPGGLYQSPAGDKWYVKEAKSLLHAQSEQLTSKLYEALGIDATKVDLVKMGDKTGVASKFRDGLSEMKSTLTSSSPPPGVFEGFAADAWLANWDVVGLKYDNLLLSPTGNAVRVDPGGALLFRAQGAPKGSAFGNVVGEIDSLRSSTNPASKAVFGRMTDEQIVASIDKVLALSDQTIRDMVESYGPGDELARNLLAEKLIARKANLAQQREGLLAKIAQSKLPPAPKVTVTPQPAAGTIGLSPTQIKINELLAKAAATNDPNEKKKIRAALRRLGHQGGLSAKPELAGFIEGRPYDEVYSSWKDSLSTKEKAAIRGWTGSDYSGITNYQLGKPGFEQYADKTAQITKAFERAPRRVQELQRGVKLKIEDFLKYKPGYEYPAKAHASWTIKESTAKNFAGALGTDTTKKDGWVSVVFRARNGSGIDIKSLSSHSSEDELMSVLGQRYRTLAVTEVKGGTYSSHFLIDVEELPFEGSSAGEFTIAKRIDEAPSVGKLMSIIAEVPGVKTLNTESLRFVNFADAKKFTKGLVTFAENNPAAAKKLDSVKTMHQAVARESKIVAQIKPDGGGKFTLEINAEMFKDPDKLSGMLKAQKASGFLAGDSVEHVIHHELGHVLELSNRLGGVSGGVVFDAVKYVEAHPPRISDLSQYGLTNSHETFAEAHGVLMTQPKESWNSWLRGFADALRMGYVSKGVPVSPQLA